MKSIIKGIAAVAACAMTVTGLAACGSSSASGEKKLDFITGMATGSVHLKTLQSITDAFEKENPGVKINLIPSSQDFTQDIKVRLGPFAVWCGWVCQVVTVLRSSLPQVR